MSDSLRDQLLKAGFSKPKPKTKPRQKNKARKPSQGSQQSKTASSSDSTTGTTTSQNQPRAGYTHVPSVPVRKKKSKKAPAVKPRAGSWSTRRHTAEARPQKSADPVAAEERRVMKARIQTLIDSSALKNFKGEQIYRFTLQNKIRELLVSESVRQQLADAQLAITRLNGETRIVPCETAAQIRAINPQWLVFLSSDVEPSSDEDDEHPIPDDLIW